MKTVTEISEFKGHPVINIAEVKDDTKAFPVKASFGYKKAKMILNEMQEIKAFVDRVEAEKKRRIESARVTPAQVIIPKL